VDWIFQSRREPAGDARGALRADLRNLLHFAQPGSGQGWPAMRLRLNGKLVIQTTIFA
jgi:hypothetical protein